MSAPDSGRGKNGRSLHEVLASFSGASYTRSAYTNYLGALKNGLSGQTQMRAYFEYDGGRLFVSSRL